MQQLTIDIDYNELVAAERGTHSLVFLREKQGIRHVVEAPTAYFVFFFGECNQSRLSKTKSVRCFYNDSSLCACGSVTDEQFHYEYYIYVQNLTSFERMLE